MRWKSFLPDSAGNYLPLNAMEDLMPFPLWKYEEYLPDNMNTNFLLPDNHAIFTSAIFTIVFVGITFYIFKKRDL